MADIQLATKLDLNLKADKSQVLTNVPVNAKFTDTVTTINGKSGAIAKADVVALGIPAQDTVYTLPSTLPSSMITGLPTSLPANGGNSATVGGFTVGMNVPANAKFTDTNTTTTINGKTGVITKEDIIALGISEKGDKGDTGAPGTAGGKGDTGAPGKDGTNGFGTQAQYDAIIARLDALEEV